MGPRRLNDPERRERRIALRPAFGRDFSEVLRAGASTDGARVIPNHESRSENPHERYGENGTHAGLDRADAVQRRECPALPEHPPTRHRLSGFHRPGVRRRHP